MANWVADFLTRNPDLTARPHSGVHHGLVFDMGGKERRIDIVGKPCHYQNGGVWLPIDTALVPITGNYWGAPGVPARFNVSDRTVEILNSTYAQRTTQVGILDAATMAIKGALSLPVGSRSGDSLIADGTIGGAAWQHVLRLTEDGVRETITLQSKPVGLPANAGDWLILDTILGGVTFPDGWVDEFDQAGMHFSLPSAWDALRETPANCRRYARTIGGIQHLYTGIPVSWLATAVYPIVIDPDFTDSTADGYVYGSNATYSTAHSTAAGLDVTGADTRIGQIVTSNTIARSFLSWDTSVIGAGSTVTQVNMTLYQTYDQSDTDFDVLIVKADWSGSNPITTGNMDTAYDLALSSSLDDGKWRSTVGIADNTSYTSENLNAVWINKTGMTYYALQSSRDRAGTQPTGLERVRVATQEDATASDRPVLTVLYSTGLTLSAVQSGTHIDLSWV